MSSYLTEEQQIQQLKDFWKRYGNVILLVVVVVALAFSGWRWWQGSHDAAAARASMAYEQLLNSVAERNRENMLVQAEHLIEHYPRSTYAALSALLLAKSAIDRGDFIDAQLRLQWVVENTRNFNVKTIANIRLARVLSAQEIYPSALEVLAGLNNPVFVPEVEELRGDIYLAMGDQEKARQAYMTALDSLPGVSTANPILPMKMANLPMTNH